MSHNHFSHPTTNNRFLLLSTSNNNRLLIFPTTFRLCQHQLLLMSNGNFLLTTLLTNHVSRNLFVNYCVHFYHHPLQPFLFSQPIPTTNHFVPGFNHFCHSLRFFLQPFASAIQPILTSTIFLFSIDPPWIFLVRLAIFMPSLQGEPCRGSSHPNSR